MKLVVTIDTEEDNWAPFSAKPTTRNGAEIPPLQQLFERFKVRPTYLLTYDMAADNCLVGFLREKQDDGLCEVGAHCHPWNTPPFEEGRHLKNSILANLPPALVRQKLVTLHERLTRTFGREPTSFRSGRWGYGPNVAQTLSDLGYRLETSVTAFTDWSPLFGPDYGRIHPGVYRFEPPQIYTPVADGTMVQLPASVGYLQPFFSKREWLERRVRETPWRWFHLVGLLDRLGLLNKVSLSPEIATGEQMVALAQAMRREGYEYLNLFFHSCTLVPGLTPFVKDAGEKTAFFDHIEQLLRFAGETGIASFTASEVATRELSRGADISNQPAAPSEAVDIGARDDARNRSASPRPSFSNG